jgi:hypothetical protein
MTMCKKCVTSDSFPGVFLDENGICNRCKEYENKKNDKEKKVFSSKEELIEALSKFRNEKRKYDVLIPLSGGVDSSATLIEIARDYGLRILAFHNDHGYEPTKATENVRKLCKKLNVDLVIEQKDYKFMKRVWKHVNESQVPGLNGCFVCGNILYANALALAKKHNIPLIINGYSKGQVELIQDKEASISWMGELIKEVTEKGDYEFIDSFLEKMSPLQNQIIYSSYEDFKKPITDNKIMVIPFFIFKFYKTDKEELKKICMDNFDWQQADNTYPARTTNCTMNWLNNYSDIKKMGYSNYHEEYSALIRVGEMTREQALADLKFNPPKGLLEELAKDIDINIEINEVS